MSAPASDVDSLAVRARCGERAAFVALVERFQAPLLHFLSLRTASREDAEELTQETFLRAWKFLERYDPRRSFATWLFTLGTRLTISAHRRRRLRTADSEVLENAADPIQPSNVLSQSEEGENLWNLARRVLSADQHSALWLRYGEDLDTHEIARVLGKREPTVRVILFRARERLGRSLGAPGTVPGSVPGNGHETVAPEEYPSGAAFDPALQPRATS